MLRLFGEIMLSLQLEMTILNRYMLKKITLAFITLASMIGIAGCNSSSSWDNHLVLQTSVAVTGFSLQSNPNVLNNLDSVYFSIDLDKALIYNADSLPMGTKTDKLVVNISTDGTSVCQLRFVNTNGVDTIVDYLTNSTDSINFSNGPVNLHLVSVDQVNSRDYQIFVNVHKMKADSLAWGRAARKSLPSLFGVPASQKTVRQGEILYCLTGYSSTYCLSTVSHPEKAADMKYITFPFTPDINSFAAADDALYILDIGGGLHRSSDKGDTWTSVGKAWYSIIGGYGNTLLGIENRAGVFYHATYPDNGKATAVPANFPVEGTSQLYIYENKWSASPQAIMLGGYNSAGKPTDKTWAYDGENWGDLTMTAPVKAARWTLVPYYETTTDSTSWRSKKADVLIAMGGIKEDGSLQPDVYVSKDLGFNWRKAEQVMQLPDYITPRYDAQAFVFTSKLTEKELETQASGKNRWISYEAQKLPSGWVVAEGISLMAGRRGTRAVKPITEWDTPYIYMYGGYNANGSLYNTVWRGVINRLEFKPIQ